MRLHTFVLTLGLLTANVVQAQLVSSAALANAAMPSPITLAITAGQFLFVGGKKEYYVRVVSTDTNETTARDSGFKLAVNMAVGAVIASETEVVDREVIRNEIVNYSSGYIDRFKILNSELVPGGVRIEMDVWVKPSALADRLLNRTAQSGQVDGARATVQLQTLNQERATGDALLQQVLNDFPRRAFDIDLKPTDILRQNRWAIMEVKFRLNWNKDYLRSMWAVLEATSQKTSRPTTTVVVNGGGWFGGFGGAAKYDDNYKYDLIANRMYAQAPTVLVTIRGSAREVLFSSCYMYQELDNTAQYSVTTNRFVEFGHGVIRFNGHYTMPGRIQIPVSSEVLSLANSVDMDVILRNQCPNR